MEGLIFGILQYTVRGCALCYVSLEIKLLLIIIDVCIIYNKRLFDFYFVS